MKMVIKKTAFILALFASEGCKQQTSDQKVLQKDTEENIFSWLHPTSVSQPLSKHFALYQEGNYWEFSRLATQNDQVVRQKLTSLLERHLKDASVISEKEIPQGTTASKILELQGNLSGVFKPKKFMRMSWPEAEVAAYQISELLNFHFVPPTVLRQYNGQKGSFQYYINRANVTEGEDLHEYPYSQSENQFELFDYIINNPDRPGNWFYHNKGFVVGFDHSDAFRHKGHWDFRWLKWNYDNDFDIPRQEAFKYREDFKRVLRIARFWSEKEFCSKIVLKAKDCQFVFNRIRALFDLEI